MAWSFGAGRGNGGDGDGHRRGVGLGGGTAGFGSGFGPFAGNFGSGGGNAGQIVFGDGSGSGGDGGGFGQQAGSPAHLAAALSSGIVAGVGSQGGQCATEKSPGFRMRVDSDDEFSDHDWPDSWFRVVERPTKKRKHEEKPSLLGFHKLQDCPDSWSKHPSKKKKQKREEEQYILSLDKLQEFIATWSEPCRQHPVDTILETMLKSYDTLTPKQMDRVKRIFTQYPSIGLLNAAVRLIGAPLCPSLKLAVPEGTDHKPGCSNEGSHKPRDSSLSLSPPPPTPITHTIVLGTQEYIMRVGIVVPFCVCA